MNWPSKEENRHNTVSSIQMAAMVDGIQSFREVGWKTLQIVEYLQFVWYELLSYFLSAKPDLNKLAEEAKFFRIWANRYQFAFYCVERLLHCIPWLKASILLTQVTFKNDPWLNYDWLHSYSMLGQSSWIDTTCRAKAEHLIQWKRPAKAWHQAFIQGGWLLDRQWLDVQFFEQRLLSSMNFNGHQESRQLNAILKLQNRSSWTYNHSLMIFHEWSFKVTLLGKKDNFLHLRMLHLFIYLLF